MCIAICHQNDNKIVITYFAEIRAQLPVVTKNTNSIIRLPWGRRKSESGKLPLGGWASIDSIKQGKWDKYFPKPVKLPIHKFMEQDFEGKSHWFDITDGQWIQGIYAQENQEKRVYIVTFTPMMEDNIFSRWPKIVSIPIGSYIEQLRTNNF